MIEIIVIEDDVEVQELLTEFLALYDIKGDFFASPSEALLQLGVKSYDLAIIDLGLPEMSGFELCKRISGIVEIPIVIFSARESVSDKLRAFELGADDYIVKSVEPIELVARIKAVVRRSQKKGSDVCDELVLDERNSSAKLYGKELALTRHEYDLLAFFVKNRGKTLSREIIASALGNYDFDNSTRGIDVLVGRIRQKLGDDAKNPSFIKSIWGEGYKFIG
jgi:two-component system, OmpR family, response regulator